MVYFVWTLQPVENRWWGLFSTGFFISIGFFLFGLFSRWRIGGGAYSPPVSSFQLDFSCLDSSAWYSLSIQNLEIYILNLQINTLQSTVLRLARLQIFIYLYLFNPSFTRWRIGTAFDKYKYDKFDFENVAVFFLLIV